MSALEKARIFDPDSSEDALHVQFNPNTLGYSVGMSGQAHKGVRDPGGGGVQREGQAQQSPIAETRSACLSIRLFYHTYTGPDDFSDVRTHINKIRDFLPAPSARGRSSSPRITFAWGTITHTGTLESFQVSYQMFAHDGTPVQAEVSIAIRGEDPDVSAESANQALGSRPAEEAGQDGGDAALGDISWMYE